MLQHLNVVTVNCTALKRCNNFFAKVTILKRCNNFFFAIVKIFSHCSNFLPLLQSYLIVATFKSCNNYIEGCPNIMLYGIRGRGGSQFLGKVPNKRGWSKIYDIFYPVLAPSPRLSFYTIAPYP